MYDDYKNQKDSLNIFPAQYGRREYSNARLLRQQQLYRKQRRPQGKKQEQQRKQQPRRTSNPLGKMKDHFNLFNKVGGQVNSTASGMLNTMKTISMAVLVIGVAAIGLTKYLNELEASDLRQNAYGGDNDISPSGRSTGKVSAKGLQLIKNQEGFHNGTSYKDQKGVWTIGYGHTGQLDGKPIGPGMKISRERAEELLKTDVARFEKAVNNSVRVPISQNMFDALVSLCYNIGPGAFASSTVVKKLNAGDYKGAAEAFKLWNKVEVKGKMVESEGLTRRRKTEMDLFSSDIGSDNKLKAPEINPVANNTYETKNLKDVGKATQVNGNGYRYGESSKITSHTKINNQGANNLYNASAGKMGTWNGVEITSGIGHRNVPGGSSFHRGLDLAYSYGTSVKPFCSGTVTYAGIMQGFGRLVIVDDANHYRHIYGHLSKINVSKGQRVTRKTEIGKSGASGTNKSGGLVEKCYAPHLHYGIWQPGGTSDKKDYIDPRTYRYPPETGGTPQTTPPKQQTPPKTPPKNNVQKPRTQNPTTTKPTVKPVAKPKPKPKTNATVKAPTKQTPKPKKTIKLDQPNRYKTK